MVFADGPLGFTVGANSADDKFLTVKTLVAGGQAVQAGVAVNDIIVASDMGAKNTNEVVSAMNTKPRPFKIPFRRATRPVPGSGI